jgi:YhcH/YjgK/YiaL family protein
MLSFVVSIPGIMAQSDAVWTKEKAAIWYSKAEWLNGLKLHPHKTTDKLEFAKQYHANKTAWDKTFAFLRDINPDSLKTGKYVIDGDNAYADVTDNPSSVLKDAKWHSHRQYCDIMYILKGKETTGIAPIAGAPVITPFNGKGDSQFYNQAMAGSYYQSNPDTFLILFPSDVHRPFIKVEGCDYVKRIRIKIKSR